ncbi:MAG: hypothetical protein CMM87_06960 [Rickettsiales bacterium]|nr:hypothetical protein [Rickettsiales bacterium]|tara:strand:- start:6127 stop:6474 length:348 start_codon:yes stop_codon:yes gene_type:complete
MSELDLNEHGNKSVNELLERAELDVVRNGSTKSVSVKELLHGLHDNTPVAKLVDSPSAGKPPAARESSKPVINQAMSSESFRKHESMRLQKQAQFEREQKEYLQRGGAPNTENYW